MHAQKIIDGSQARMDRCVHALSEGLQSLRAGRADPLILAKLVVQADGASVPLASLATLRLLDARCVLAIPWDKSHAPAVEKAIREAGLGFNPSWDGQAVRVPMPAMSQERREEMAKAARAQAEEARVGARKARQAGNDVLKAAGEAQLGGADAVRRAQRKIQEIADSAIIQIDRALAEKERAIMGL